MSLVKRRDIVTGAESLITVVSSDLELVIVNTNPSIRVTDCEIEVEIVSEVVVWVECEFGELSIGDVEFNSVGSENEPDD